MSFLLFFCFKFTKIYFGLSTPLIWNRILSVSPPPPPHLLKKKSRPAVCFLCSRFFSQGGWPLKEQNLPIEQRFVPLIVVVVVLLFYVHGKHLRSS